MSNWKEEKERTRKEGKILKVEEDNVVLEARAEATTAFSTSAFASNNTDIAELERMLNEASLNRN